ncbi:MAG: hypothetical protein P4K98_06580 [Bryobacteraceae bacterium]|nr:hypothetical protein [Bryobacteraceae bacterium]
MEEICTCGARLVPDALFCHRCGRPLRPLIAEEEPAEPEEVPPPPPEPVPDRVVITSAVVEPEANVDFRNRIVIKSCFLAACFSLISGMLLSPIGSGALFPLVLFGGGWIASYLYCRNSARPVNVRSGAALGWIAGLFTFLILLLFITLLFAALVSNPEFVQLLRDNSGKYGARAEDMNQLLDLPKHPDRLALGLGLNFVQLTVFSSLGGLLHAFARRRRNG